MQSRNGTRLLGGLVAACLVVSGCARFDDRESTPFTPVPEAQGGGPPGPPPGQGPPQESPEQPDEQSEPPPEGPCVDPDPAVIVTCLEPTYAATDLVDRALVADASGRLVSAAPESEPVDFARIDVGAGRVASLAPSPAYEEDRLVFALVVGDGPSRIERVARDQESVTVSELPPGEAGGLAFHEGETLEVGVGGERFSFDYDGVGDPGEPEVSPLAGDVRAVCSFGPDLYFSVASPNGAALHRPGSTVWTWPDQQDVGGCAAASDGVAVAMPEGQRVDLLPMADGVVAGEPLALSEETYGRFGGVVALPDGTLVGTTVNKDGGDPVETDDRAVVLEMPVGGGGGDSRT